MEFEFTVVQKKALKAAKDLLYGQEVIDKLLSAKTEGEVGRIMTTARRDQLG